MPEYEPKSDVLKSFAASEASTSDVPPTETNLRLLLAMIRDEDRSNRDWAAFLLSICSLDTPEVREALLRAAADDDPYVSGEAILGLANRSPELALPLVQKALTADSVVLQVFEAAAILAHPSLVEDLSCFLEPLDDSVIEMVASEAFDACKTGIRPYPPKSFVREC